MARTTDPALTEARRTAISDAAAGLFATKGFEGTTAADIARATGLSSGSVFYYFTDKRAVFRSIFEADLAGSRAMIERHAGVTDPIAAVLAIVDEMATDIQDPATQGLVVELIRQFGRDPELDRVVMETNDLVVAGLAAHIDRGRAAGVVDPSLDATEAAGWVQSIVDGAFLSADPDRDPRPMLHRIVTAFLRTPPATSAPHDTEGETP
ncbi:TetR family transcriptional regulator [Pseudonocardia sediminis]|uniref:TetR family transcriptional regulator n=1 Tax=Pseudonocardia sediminis TaxID=1397368 RepID=A0A4V2FQ56_PSEST|nr:TetR/AcrR family transcriptional regulator [Pseudonocardia sediminis]RZT83410.1 TetR family transcriptional regulator [Pseudonocardia sediminis]